MRLMVLPLLLILAACQQQSEPVSENKQEEVAAMSTVPYGSWPSPISAESIVQGSRFMHSLYHDEGYLYWVEGRPEEGGRSTIMRWRAGSDPEEILPAPWNARSRVQEYGGRSILVAGGTIWFSNFADQRLYRFSPGQAPVAITPEAPLRFGACILDAQRERLICIREDHRPVGEPENTLVALPLQGESEGEVLFSGADFVSAAALSPDGEQIAFVHWDHPNMPWDNTSLVSARFAADGTLAGLVTHNPDGGESLFDPQWDRRGRLHVVSDRNNWWSLYRVVGTAFELLDLPLVEAEVGGPQWSIGEHEYRFLPDGRIVAAVSQWGIRQLYILDPERGSAELLALDSASVTDFVAVDDLLYVIHSPVDRPGELLATDAAGTRGLVIRRSRDDSPAPAWVPEYQPVNFPTGGGATAYGNYYPPTNPEVLAPAEGAPPLLVFVHGGPTASARPVMSLSTMYWTSRGFAVLDLNYRGSTGYGREYRRALYGQWGVADVEDAVAGARWLAGQGLADPDKLIISGGSAGGYTTLAAHAFHDTFSAGTSYFGISDIEALAHETHKFESRYADQMIGPYPERRDLYVERSPIHHLEGFNAPLLLLQGLDDKVVPPNQSEMIFEALKSRGVPTAYISFEGEGHGFRKSENQVRALEAEYYFYARVLGLEPAEALPPVDIIGLDEAR